MTARSQLAQLSGETFLTDGGLETDLIFNHGIEIPNFAAHTLLPDGAGREAMADYFRGFLSLARDKQVGFVLDSQTWKAHSHWASDLAASTEDLHRANHESIHFVAGLRDEFADNAKPVVLNAVIGPRGDAYGPGQWITAEAAAAYHAQQIGWLSETDVDMVTALTFTSSAEAIGITRAAQAADLPIVVSFTVETDGNLPTGQSLPDAITAVDAATDSGPAYFMINCAHPTHFAHVLEDGDWSRRIHGLRCNASQKSHAELGESDTLDDGDPHELGGQYRAMAETLPWLNVFGGCCGSDLRHLTEIAEAVGG